MEARRVGTLGTVEGWVIARIRDASAFGKRWEGREHRLRGNQVGRLGRGKMRWGISACFWNLNDV